MKAAGQKDFPPMGEPGPTNPLEGHHDQALEAVHGNAKAPEGQTGSGMNESHPAFGGR